MTPTFSMTARIPRAAVVISMAALSLPAHAQLPISGRPVPELSHLDTIMSDFMTDSGRSISAGVLGVSRGGRVIFLHAYGYLSDGVALPETALFRLASVVKPVTAAAVHQFAQTNGLGPTQLQRRAFNLSGNGGIYTIAPPSAPDANARNITIGHLLDHCAGWDRNQPNPGDIPINRVRAAGIAMNNPDALPTRRQLVDWAMQFPLNFQPGSAIYNVAGSNVVPGPGTTYSNFGYLVLGEILETSAPGGYLGYLRNGVLSPLNWIPSTEWGLATTLRAQNNPREPLYESTEGEFPSVFDYTPPIDQLPAPYGGNYHLETMLAHGGLIASALAMLRFGQLYSVMYQTRGAGATQSNDIGLPIPATGLPNGGDASHTGSLPGASTILRQRGQGPGAADDEVIFIAFNKRDTPPAPATADDWAARACGLVAGHLDIIAAGGTWPTQTCDGFWVTLGPENANAGHGGYHSSFSGFQSALDRVTDGSGLRLFPGQQAWRGKITKRVRLDAPEGVVRIGP
jgi:CubicO group peptidase (beta-lactamase class C family)